MLQDTVKGKIARVLAMCHLGQQQLDKAMSFCKLSETYQPGLIATSFIMWVRPRCCSKVQQGTNCTTALQL